jgi:signal transduction histidine kinase
MAEQLAASYGELERRVEERTEELSRLYQENLAASEARSQFFATISHEFRTPLFAILANIEMLADPSLGPTTDDELRESLSTIDGASRLLLERVNEMLDLARTESTGLDLQLGPVELASVWDELGPTVAALARSNDLTLVVDLDAGLPAVWADGDRLRQIVLNLTSNAVKYTPAGGTVTVAAAPRGDDVEISVSDTGIGIPKSVGDRVFEPYYRVKGSRAQGRWASTGLGLALTKRLVEAHGGRIRFESTKRGTTFYVELPSAGGDGYSLLPQARATASTQPGI